MTASVLLLLLLDGGGASAASAAPAETVILLQPSAASLAVRRSLARIRDELSADRFQVVLADSSSAGDLAAVVERAAPGRQGGTTLALFGDPEQGQAELCVVRHAAGRTAVRRVEVVVDDPERMAEALAKRALELLRATSLELSIEAARAPRPPGPPERGAEPDVPSSSTAAAAAPETTVVAVDMGIGVWNSIDGAPLAFAPVGRVGVRVSQWAWARVSAAGLGSRPRLETAYGTATFSQAVALAEFSAVFRRDKRVRPTFSLGAGVLNVAVIGAGAAPYEDRAPERWSAAFDAGVGAAFAVAARTAVVTELHALLASPHPVVRFADTRAATVGYPSLMLTVALQVGL